MLHDIKNKLCDIWLLETERSENHMMDLIYLLM